MSVLTALKEHLLSVIFCYSFVFLSSVFSVSMHYRFCLATLWKKSKMRGIVWFSNRTECWCLFSWVSMNKTAYFRNVQSSSFQSYDWYSNHGKTFSAMKNSGWKPKVSECIIVYWRGLCQKIIEQLQPRRQWKSILILKNLFPQKEIWWDFHKSNIYGTAAFALLLINENNA